MSTGGAAGQPAADPPEPGDRHPWRAAIWLGLVAILFGISATTWIPVAIGCRGWWIPGDAWASLRAAHYLPMGTYPLIYETGTLRDVYVAGPVLPLLLAPVAVVSNHFHMRESYPYPQHNPASWLVFGPYAFACVIPLLYSVRSLATRLGVRAGRVAIQVAFIVLVFVPIAVVYGHFEDALAVALLCIGFRDLFERRDLRGALWVTGAILCKQWAFLAVPVFVAACPRQLRRRAAVNCLVPATVVMGLFLAADYKYASRALLHPPTYPQIGHAAMWISTASQYQRDVPARWGAVLLACAVAWTIHRRPDPAMVITALGCALFGRAFFESVLHAYYLAPGIGFLVLAEYLRGRSIIWKAIPGALAMLVFPWHPPRVVWWAVFYVLALVVVAEPTRALGRHARQTLNRSARHRPAVPVGSGA
jgi:hypothetical protein